MANKILIVDDTSTVRMFVKMVLSSEGYELDEAQNGAEAVEKTTQTRPDVVLMDINMPVMDGIEACRNIKQQTASAGIAVIMVTTRGEEDQVKRAYEAGCDDYVTKPIRKIELLSKIRKCLSA